MKPYLETLLWTSTATLVAATLLKTNRAGGLPPVEQRRVTVVPELMTATTAETMDSLANEINDGDVFRLARTPSRVAYQLKGEPMVGPFLGPPPQQTPQTPLQLRAIVGGPPWQAVIDGLPGQAAGTLVRSGDKFATMVIRSIGRDTVVVQSPDSTYRLAMRSDW